MDTIQTKIARAEIGREAHAEAVERYLQGLKEVRKRSGELQAFHHTKLSTSIQSALMASGINDQVMAGKIGQRAVFRLERAFLGVGIPTTAEIREVVGVVLIDHNLPHVAKTYLTHDKVRDREPPPERYGLGIPVTRRYSSPDNHPFDLIKWERRDARITNEKGLVVFEQKDVEVPVFYSATATNILVSKYFRGRIGTPGRETSVRQMITRVAHTIADWGRVGAYFASPEDADAFEMELTHILVNQMAAFNSPVWFNVGIVPKPQCSACFINSVQDDMRSILHLAVTEGMLFKYGSGTGSNLSKLRSSFEQLGNSSGKSSGPVSFMKGWDAFAGVIKSGGKTRRAAKMVILNIDHPDIREFILCKAKEEKKAWALVEAGYDSSLTGEAYASIFFQNANNSVRVTDDFMNAVREGGAWKSRAVTTGETVWEASAREIAHDIAEASWLCGDPGVQYDDTIQKWNPCANSERINATNPCSEYVFLDDTACNLASLNLMKFRRSDGSFDVDSYRHANEIVITAMEIIVGNSSYPTPAIEQNSHDFRPLGIGYANLGALLMARGLAYDSPEGRNMASAITALASGVSYVQSSRIASRLGPFRAYHENKEPFLRVMGMHREASYQIHANGVPKDLLDAARASWDEVLRLGREFGYRNAQISLLAPTGTISFLMDCDTTGVEPDIALVKYKWLVGGGMMKLVNNTVPEALRVLGYSGEELKAILAYIDEHDTIEGAPGLREEHLGVFDCAFKPAQGVRAIPHMAHVRMMAAVQPFISGAISKTVNMPESATPEDIWQVYEEGWKMGLKAIAIYRDGSKRQQPLTTSAESDPEKTRQAKDAGSRGSLAREALMVASRPGSGRLPTTVEEGKPLKAEEKLHVANLGDTTVDAPRRRRLPDERRAITHKFAIGAHEGYITVGLYDDGSPGEIFVTMSKEGSVISGLMDAFATATSIGLQYGVPLRVLTNKMAHLRFEPSGYTGNPQIPIAKSIIDYVFRWLALKFLSLEDQTALGVQIGDQPLPLPGNLERSEGYPPSPPQTSLFESKKPKNPGLTATFDNQSDAPACDFCGSMMVRNASCYKCLNCGGTSGCS